MIKIKIKSKLKRIISFLLAGIFIGGVAYAAVSGKILLKGVAFKTTVIELKFLKNLAEGNTQTNLTSEINGVSFDQIINGWSYDYLVKLANTSSANLNVSSFSNYQTDLDPADLRYSLFVELFPWNDANNNGVVEETELGLSLGKKSFVKWKTEGFNLGTFEPGKIYGYTLRFTAEGLTDAKQGKSGVFDFEFGILN